MSIDTYNSERFHGDEDQYIRTEQIGRRLSIIEIAAVNFSLAKKFNMTPHVLKNVIDMNDHFNPKNFVEIAEQKPVHVSASTQLAADKMMNPDQLGLYTDAPVSTEWDKALDTLGKSVDHTAVDTSSEAEVIARQNVASAHGATPFADEVEQWLMNDAMENI